MGAAEAEADRTLFVGNLETKVTEELLFELFHQVSAGLTRAGLGWAGLPCSGSWREPGVGRTGRSGSGRVLVGLDLA